MKILYKLLIVLCFLGTTISMQAEKTTYLTIHSKGNIIISALINNDTKIDFHENMLSIIYDENIYEVSKNDISQISYTSVSSVERVLIDPQLSIQNDRLSIVETMIYPLFIYNTKGIILREYKPQAKLEIALSELPKETIIIKYGSLSLKLHNK